MRVWHAAITCTLSEGVGNFCLSAFLSEDQLQDSRRGTG